MTFGHDACQRLHAHFPNTPRTAATMGAHISAASHGMDADVKRDAEVSSSRIRQQDVVYRRAATLRRVASFRQLDEPSLMSCSPITASAKEAARAEPPPPPQVRALIRTAADARLQQLRRIMKEASEKRFKGDFENIT